jgi:hypothetical protein
MDGGLCGNYVSTLDIAAEEQLFPVFFGLGLLLWERANPRSDIFDGTNPRCALCEATNMTLLSSESSPYYDV